MNMKYKVKLIAALLFGIVTVSNSQTISNQVINSAGGSGAVGSTGFTLHYNIGETVINTIQGGSNTVAQGFLQPDNVNPFNLTATSSITQISCAGNNDGAIALTPTVTGVTSTVAITYQYYWSPSSICPGNNCQTVSNLSAGTYSVLIVATNGTQSDSTTVTNLVINTNTTSCFSVAYTVSDISCLGKTDGAIVLTPTIAGLTSSTTVNYQYFWSPSSICPANDCQTVDSLLAGIYSVTVLATYGSQTDTLKINSIQVNDNLSPCILEIYNGVTPNGDGKNDFFYLGNIDQFPNNIVTIYSRWGQLMSRIEKYDNADKKWNGHDVNNNVAPSGTYFFVIELGDGSKPIKGWIELINK